MRPEAVTVVSNRLPVRIQGTAGAWTVEPSDGGLVGALEPVLRASGGTWVGWAGAGGALAPDAFAELERYGRGRGIELRSVSLSPWEHDVYYERACNQALWPVLHGLVERSRLGQWHARAYHSVNRRFAEAAAAASRGGTVWVHDYHLLQTGEVLRRRFPAAKLGFFLHTPFPSADVMRLLPESRDLVASLACFDLIGFQTAEDRRNFAAWLGGMGAQGSARAAAAVSGRTEVFPISVDWTEFHERAGSPAVLARAAEIRREVGERKILLGVDRLDYTKGIPERLRAYQRLLERHPELRERVVFVQLAVPSRTSIEEYRQTKDEVEQLVRRINTLFGRGDWSPVRYVYGSWARDELLAWYVAADVAVVTPLRDGMNLVAKEFVAANRGRGVLVLSPGAGSARELGSGALLADPRNEERLTMALRFALAMPAAERRSRLTRLQHHLRGHDVHHWAASFLEALAAFGGAGGVAGAEWRSRLSSRPRSGVRASGGSPPFAERNRSLDPHAGVAGS